MYFMANITMIMHDISTIYKSRPTAAYLYSFISTVDLFLYLKSYSLTFIIKTSLRTKGEFILFVYLQTTLTYIVYWTDPHSFNCNIDDPMIPMTL